MRYDLSGLLDDLTYYYPQVSGKTTSNRLRYVRDAVSGSVPTDDIENQASSNYRYDGEGRLTQDEQEEIRTITWLVNGKVKSIERTPGSTKKNLTFDYDAMGHRIAKHISTSAGVLEKSTYYVLDAQGNTMSVYERIVDASQQNVSYEQVEKHIYGSSRLGVNNRRIPMLGSQNSTFSMTTVKHHIGERSYELSNHLGNVLSVISDLKMVATPESYITVTDQTGLTITGNTITRNVAGTGWNVCGGASVETLSQGQYMEWSLGGTTIADNYYNIVGLSYTNTNNNSSSVKYGWYTHTSGLTIIESGNLPPGITVYGTFGAFTTSTKLRISRENGKINYYINGVLQRSADDVQPNTVMIIDFAMWQYGRSIYGLEIGTINEGAVVLQATDYSPFGVQLDGRNMTKTGVTNEYRRGYQGSEMDNEIKGSGNSYTTFFRQLDPRLGRWLSLDPKTSHTPWESPYVSMGNNPITGNDPLGDFTRKRGGDPMKRAERYARRHGLKGENSFFTRYKDGSVGIQRKDDSEGGATAEAYFKASKSYSRKYQAKLESEQQAKWAREHSPFLANFRAPGAKFDYNHVPIDFPKTYDIAGPLGNIFAQTFIIIGTGGVGLEVGIIRAGLTSALINGGTNYTGQLVANDFDNSKVDFAGVGISFASGFISKNPFAVGIGSSALDASVDYSSSEGLRTVVGNNKKGLGRITNDFVWNSIGNSGAASFGKNPPLFEATGALVTGVPTNVINTTTNDALFPEK